MDSSNLEELLTGELSTDLPEETSEANTEEPDLSTYLTVSKEEELVAVPEKSQNVLAEGSETESVDTESKEESRKKRQTNEENHHDTYQHLDQLTNETDSSRLPVEHRGLDDEENEHDSHEGHDHSGSSQSAPWSSMLAVLFFFVGLTRYQLHHL